MISNVPLYCLLLSIFLIPACTGCIPISRPPIPLPVPGEACNRDCTLDKENKTCNFELTLEHLFTDTEGRLADGRNRSVLAYNGRLPGPPIVVCQGDKVNIKLTNKLTDLTIDNTRTTLHLHGIPQKNRSWSDGVPKINQCPLETGETFLHYGFDGLKSGAVAGTYWYHSHVGKQREDGAYGALIIKERRKRQLFDVDDARNTLILQEWYRSIKSQIPTSILVNGKGRVGTKLLAPPEGQRASEFIESYLKGDNDIECIFKNNSHFDPNNHTTNYEEILIDKPGYIYRFRLIGAISQNFPLYITIEEHTFKAIATDSINIRPVSQIGAVWISNAERYDILVNTYKKPLSKLAYKIKIYGHTQKGKCPLCTIAWLKYPGQIIDHNYTVPYNCKGFHPNLNIKTLNPVPNIYAITTNPNSINVSALQAIDKPIYIDSPYNMNTHYIEFENLSFNKFTMPDPTSYPNIPYLFQSPSNYTDRCYRNPASDTPLLPSYCSPESHPCECQHVIQEEFIPGNDDWWFEIVLINTDDTVAHPIHQHGGWYRVVAMIQYPPDMKINRTYIMDQDKNCDARIRCLPRNLYNNPPSKDTIQVPTNGYVILRTPLTSNSGTWIVHCHIDFHVLAGMAMVLQIGELGQASDQEWSLGNFKNQTNIPCPPGKDTSLLISWYYGMRNDTTRCVKPGQTVTFIWYVKEHNVNVDIPKDVYITCKETETFTWNSTEIYGNYEWQAPSEQRDYYFACGVGDGYHCNYGGLKAKITVDETC